MAGVDQAADILDEFPAEAQLVAVADIARLRANDAGTELLELFADRLPDTFRADACSREIWESASLLALGSFEATSSARALFAAKIESPPACLTSSSLLLKKYGLLYRPEASLLLWASEPELLGRFATEKLKSRSPAAELLRRIPPTRAVRMGAVLPPALGAAFSATLPASKARKPTRGLFAYLDSTDAIEVGLGIVFAASDDAAAARDFYQPKMTDLLQALGAGDFSPVVQKASWRQSGAEVTVDLGLEMRVLRELVQRVEALSRSPRDFPQGTPSGAIIVLPVGSIVVDEFMSDDRLERLIRDSSKPKGYVYLPYFEGMSHERLTEVVEMVSPLGVPVYVPAKAVSWPAARFETACLEQDNAIACLNLALAVRFAYGFEADMPRAARLADHGCNLGDPLCCSVLADHLEYGLGVDKDTRRALALNSRLCEKRGSSCFAAARILYLDSAGLKNTTKAREHLYTACERGFDPACRIVACMSEGKDFAVCADDQQHPGLNLSPEG